MMFIALRKSIILLCAGALVWCGYVLYDRFITVCDYPLTYSIRSFDTRFALSQGDAIQSLARAERIWESEMNTELFSYVPEGGDITVDFIFDERQQKTQQALSSEKNIELQRSVYDARYQSYTVEKLAFEKRSDVYQDAKRRYEEQLEDYNQRVIDLRRRGSVQKEEIAELEELRISLEAMMRHLERERQELNEQVTVLNEESARIQQLGEELHQAVQDHNQQFGESRQFDQGVYQNNNIAIYQFEGFQDLDLVLAHELGHALGLEHVENSQSIMYYLMDEQRGRQSGLTNEDKAEFRRVCKVD